MTLRLAKDLTLLLDTVTQAVAILAKRRAGKSYLARRLAEELARTGQQLVIVDPKGDWWGIRSAADGKSPGLPIVVLGAGYTKRTRQLYVQNLQTKGLVERRDGRIVIMGKGVATVPPGTKMLPRGKALVQHFIKDLPVGEGAILEMVLAAHPKPLPLTAIEAKLGYTLRTRQLYIQNLQTREAIKRVGKDAIIHPAVFE